MCLNEGQGAALTQVIGADSRDQCDGPGNNQAGHLLVALLTRYLLKINRCHAGLLGGDAGLALTACHKKTGAYTSVLSLCWCIARLARPANTQEWIQPMPAGCLPAFSWVTWVVTGSNTLSIWPPSKSCTAGTLSWYGTWSCSGAWPSILSSSPNCWFPEPEPVTLAGLQGMSTASMRAAMVPARAAR